jgi:two-component system sensor histidine kinase MprB
MTLRRRLTAAAALAVAAVAVTLGVVGYLTTRSHLVSELQSELHQRAFGFLQPHAGGGPDGGGANRGANAGNGQGNALPQTGDGRVPTAPPFGGATGYFQSVYPNGRAVPLNPNSTGSAVQLPVNTQVLTIARNAKGSHYFTATVKGTHVGILVVGDSKDAQPHAIEVALPLTSVDSVLHGLVLSYGLLIGAGILLAIIFGTVIARAALAPIERFSAQTEQVTSALDRPRRLEETGADELRRLAASFNQTLDALERSIASQRQLIADASHELRTPMAALRSNIQIFLEAHRLPEEDRRELQGAIVAELDELTQLVTDVLELARGAVPNEHTEVIELDAVVRDAVARTQRRAPHLSFELDIEPTLITNAPDRVNRAVTNVVDNARKWSPDGASIEISLRDGVLTVRDHGPGFGDDDLGHVFDRFYRAHSARRMPGSGLGLAIVKQAAEAHGGFAQAANAPHGGALLRVAFGSAASEPSAPAASAAMSH